MSPEIALIFFLPVIVFVIGACVGSFLNIVIHRVPLGLKVRKSKGSFCPDCKRKIRLRHRIPIISWIWLRGKCRSCKSKISPRYFLVELVTGFVYFAIWALCFPSLGIWGVIALWVLAALMIAATFIDFGHMIIPDSITFKGLAFGLMFSAIVPALHKESTWYNGLFSGVVGVVVGFGLLWGIVMLGKVLFGRIRHDFVEPVDFQISQPGGPEDAIVIQLGPEFRYKWHEVFFRRWDKLKMVVSDLRINGEPTNVNKQFSIRRDGFVIDGVKRKLDSVASVSGKCTRAVVPREAVGYGNVKFVTMIGAFVGWQAVLVTTLSAFGIVAVMKRFLKGNTIPFTPFLALGALIFILFKLT